MDHILASDLNVRAVRQDIDRDLHDPHRAVLREWRRVRAEERRAARRRTFARVTQRIRGAVARPRPRPT
jgi:hypothetical protein